MLVNVAKLIKADNLLLHVSCNRPGNNMVIGRFGSVTSSPFSFS